MRKLLFVCSQNKLRSPTAEAIFSGRPGVETRSAGLNHDARIPLTTELVEWSDIIFVMEKAHRNKLSKRFKPFLKGKRIVCLDVPDEFEFMEPALIRLLEARIGRFLTTP